MEAEAQVALVSRFKDCIAKGTSQALNVIKNNSMATMQDLAKSYITLRGKVFGATMATKVSYWLTTTPRLVESGPLTHGSTPGRREHGSGHLVGSPAVWTIGHFVTTRGSLRWMLGFLSFLAWTVFFGVGAPFRDQCPRHLLWGMI